MKHAILVVWLALAISAVTAAKAAAQSTTGDAREVGLGGVAFAPRILEDSAGRSAPRSK